VDAYSFASLQFIESIDLTACRLVHIDRRGFAGCPHLVDLSIAGNNLSQLVPATVEYLPSPSVLKRLRVDDNPWLCDCRLRWLHERIQTAATVGVTSGLQQPVCNAPHLLRSIQWKHLSPKQFACPSRIITEGRRDSTHVVAATGANVTISCVVVGDPEPTVRWTRNSPTFNTLPLPSVSRRYDSETTTADVERLPPWRLVSSLKLIDVDVSDAGEYRCMADNPAGRAEITYTVVITSVAGSNSSKARDHRSHGIDAVKTKQTTVRKAVVIISAIVAVTAAGVAGCVVVIRLRTVELTDDVKKRPSDIISKSAMVVGRSLSVTVDRHERCTTSLVGSTCQQAVCQPMSVAWADYTLSALDDDNYRRPINQREETTTFDQHQFRMRIFPAACGAYD